jgi:hypothetical protein
MDETLRELRRPFTPSAVRWKLQSVHRDQRGGIVVAYLDARLVIERLNTVVGLDWRDEYDEFIGATRCRLTVKTCDDPYRTVTREDVGIGNDPKSRISDALKRAGVKFGIGVSIYALAQVNMRCGGARNQLGLRKAGGKDVPDLTLENREWLAETYERWLDTPRGQQFGEPLEHGDELGAQGFDDEGAPKDLPPVEEASSPEAEAEREAALERTRALAAGGS